MYEIEAKVPLTKGDFQRLKKEIPKMAKRKGSVINKDTYYANPKTFYLRIRKKNGKGLLNLKSKKMEQGIEINQEIELPLISASKFHRFLKKIDIPINLKKVKITELFELRTLQIELNKIEDLGYFLEIENIVHSESGIPKAKKALIETFKMLGFSPKDFEKKYYLELLAEKAKRHPKS